MGVGHCERCGACCAAFRVDFDCSELVGAGGGVPEAAAVPLIGRLMRMRGTDAVPPRCEMLAGEIGVAVGCRIYEGRPGPCRDFAPYATLGMADEACERARRRHGLPPLG